MAAPPPDCSPTTRRAGQGRRSREGRSRTPLTSEKIAELMPMASASVSTMTSEKRRLAGEGSYGFSNVGSLFRENVARR